MRRPKSGDLVLLAILVLILFFGVLAPAYVAGKAAQDARKLQCLTVQANRDQLHALNAISKDLGLPHRYPIPPETAECAAILQP